MEEKVEEINLKKLKNKIEANFLGKKIEQLSSKKESLEKQLKEKTELQKKYFKVWNKYNKWIIVSITLSLCLILISLIFILVNFNGQLKFENGITLYFETNLWNNLFFLGLSIFTVSFIFYQLKKSTIHQMQVNMFWKEFEAIESISEVIDKLKFEISKKKASKYLNEVPTLYIDGEERILKDYLDPEIIKDPDVKQVFTEIKNELDEILEKQKAKIK